LCNETIWVKGIRDRYEEHLGQWVVQTSHQVATERKTSAVYRELTAQSPNDNPLFGTYKAGQQQARQQTFHDTSHCKLQNRSHVILLI
jgi:hypothetical protein